MARLGFSGKYEFWNEQITVTRRSSAFRHDLPCLFALARPKTSLVRAKQSVVWQASSKAWRKRYFQRLSDRNQTTEVGGYRRR